MCTLGLENRWNVVWTEERVYLEISKALMTTGTEKKTASDCGQFARSKSILLNNLLFDRNTEVKYAFNASALSDADNNLVPQGKLSRATLWDTLRFLLTWLKKALVEREFITRSIAA